MSPTELMLAAPAAALGLVLVLAGCGSADSHRDMGAAPPPAASTAPSSAAASTRPAAGPHGDADVRFASRMIPHHRQAIEMSTLLLDKDGIDPDVIALAQRIKDAQGPEVAQMMGWLTGWGADPSMGGMDRMGGGSDDGMMSSSDIKALEAAEGSDATRQFLDGMTAHHDGAIAMARTELETGSNPDAQDLARTIVDTQQAEIDQELGSR